MMSVLHFFLLHPLIFLCIGLPIGLAKSSTLGNETDRLALLAFKDLIHHDPQQIMSSWNDSLHFCKWTGIVCSRRHQRVVTLDLRSLGLVGYMSPSIGNLSFLHTIILANNSFQGAIPQDVGRLFRLEIFRMGSNSFGGEIPVNLSQCSNLKKLNLVHNKFVGNLPTEIGSVSKLSILALNDNNLSGGIPTSFGNLSSLITLSLADNSLQGSIPDSLGQLKNLDFLGLGPNFFSGTIPPSLYNNLSSITMFSVPVNQLTGNLPLEIGLNLPNLEFFFIEENNFFGSIPVSLFNASQLQKLSISENNFSGKVPIEIGNLNGLEYLSLEFNHLGSGKENDLNFLNSLTNCTKLQSLFIDGNHFGGKLPNFITHLSNQLTSLDLSQNQIFGSIPSRIGNLTNLIELSMANNFLTGSIPNGIGLLQKLQKLNLSGNRLSGYIPNSLGNNTNVFSLDLSNNFLVGSVISDFKNYRLLQTLDLSKNNLNGTILGLSSQLLHLILADNSLTGSLPLEVGNLKNLEVLDVSENNMSQEIPSTLGGCLSLQQLSLSGNFFQGPIPSSFSSLKNLQDLDLSRNNLSGKIPKDLDDLFFLKKLNLSFNNFEGEVPIKGVFQNASEFIFSGNNKLCGGIPELQLPACPIKKSKQRRTSLAPKVTIGIIISVLSIVGASFLVIYWMRKPRMKSSFTFSLGDFFKRISYNGLNKATDGFSSANLIGLGNFGSVYKGVLHPDETLVAVKVLNLNVRGASKSFITECKALRKARHRNLLKIITACSSMDFSGNDFKALVFEFMPNGSLENWLHPNSDDRPRSRDLNLGQRLNIAIDIACAMDYLHNRCQTQIIHCDLKPSNVLLDNEMVAHVGDFGLAKILAINASNSGKIETNSVLVKGSIGYIPPEYGMGTEVSTQGDVYSYGVLLLELLTGKRPTDAIFNDGLSLHHFSKMALNGRLMEILDPHLCVQEHNEAINDFENQRYNTIYEMQEYLISMFRIGVACSAESVGDRMEIKDVLMELQMIKKMFIEDRTHQ